MIAARTPSAPSQLKAVRLQKTAGYTRSKRQSKNAVTVRNLTARLHSYHCVKQAMSEGATHAVETSQILVSVLKPAGKSPLAEDSFSRRP